MPPGPAHDRLPATVVLGFLSETLGELARRVERVEAHVASLIDRKAVQDRAGMMALQDLDLVRQTAEDAARIAEIACKHDGGERAGLMGSIRLASLRDGLASTTMPGEAACRDAAPQGDGRVEFFGASPRP